MKILVDGRTLANKTTGISRYAGVFIDFFIQQYGKENVLVLINPELKHRPFNYIETDLRVANMVDFLRFHRLLKTLDFDILFSPFYSSTWKKDKNKQYFIVVHDLMYHILPAFFSANFIINKFAQWYFDFIVSRSIKNSHIISVSETTQKDVKKVFGKDSFLSSEGIYGFSQPVPQESRTIEELGLKDQDYFLYVGNQKPHKNIPFLINSFLNSQTDKKLVLCGPSDVKPINHDNIIQLGFVDDRELESLYQHCYAYVFPSLYEGFGIPVLEAASLGCRILCSNGGALSEFSAPFIHFFDPQNSKELSAYFSNPNLPKPTKTEIDSFLRKYDWSQILTNFSSFFSKKIVSLQ